MYRIGFGFYGILVFEYEFNGILLVKSFIKMLKLSVVIVMCFISFIFLFFKSFMFLMNVFFGVKV